MTGDASEGWSLKTGSSVFGATKVRIKITGQNPSSNLSNWWWVPTLLHHKLKKTN